MKRFLFAFVATIFLGSFAFADKPHGRPSRPHSVGVHVSNYHGNYAKPFVGGLYYPGRSYNHWTYQSYWPKYGCTCYWCPSTRSYYYWYAPAGCYYPISYIASAPPAFVKLQVNLTAPPDGIPVLPD